MNLIDMDADKPYVLDGKYQVDTLKNFLNISAYSEEKVRQILQAILEISDEEYRDGATEEYKRFNRALASQSAFTNINERKL